MNRRKELVMQYLERDQPMGVYRVVNKESGRMFVGSSPNLEGIWNRHRFSLNMGIHTNKRLQGEWTERGEAAFEFEVLERLKPRDGEPPTKVSYDRELGKLEEAWLEKLQPYGERGYNG